MNAILVDFEQDDFRPMPLDAKRWRFAAEIVPGFYNIKIWIDTELAYNCDQRLGDDIV